MAITAAPTRPVLGQKAGQDVNVGFIWWAHILVVLPFAGSYVFANFLQAVTIIRNGSVVLGALWLVIAFVRYRVQARWCLPVALLLFLQIWGTFSSAFVSATFGRSIPFNYADLLFLRYIYMFFVASILIQIQPSQRLHLMRTIIVVCGANALVQYLQFVHFAPAFALSQADTLGYDLQNWDQRAGTRAAGFYTFSGNSALPDALVAAWFVGQLAVRKLSAWEHFGFFFFVGGSFIAQARTHLPGLLLVFAFYLFFLIRSERERAPAIISGIFAGIGVLLAVAYNRLAYIFGESFLSAANLRYRSSVAWNQANAILKDFPWTGVGPDPSVISNRSIFADKYSLERALEQGWLALQAQFGVVGLLLGMIAIGATIFSPMLILPKPQESAQRKGLVISLALMATCIALGMMGNTVLHWETSFYVFLLTAGLFMRTTQEQSDFTQASYGLKA
ncbi:MAG: O-antigen ligase family protein [Armatimonadetes bacterium]|nr:O-antigen ligase family protein [Armatimonadota bacterium]